MPVAPPLLRRPTFLRALSIALAAVFALPSCFTAMVWQDDRHQSQPLKKTPPELQAFRLPDASGAIVVSLPEKARGPLSAMQPWLPPSTKWLLVRPIEHEAGAVAVLACSAVTGLQLRPRLEIREEEGRGTTLHFCAWADMRVDDARLRALMRDLPGTHREGNFVYATREFDAACSFEPLVEQPARLGEPLRDLELVHQVIHDDGTNVFERLAWTPLALLGDVVLLPFEIWAWIVMLAN